MKFRMYTRKDNKYKIAKNENLEAKVIELNLSATVAVIVAIIVLIVTVTSVKVITTIIAADENKKLNNNTQVVNERVTYVNSTLKDESGNIVNETDEDGNVIQVPVPKGYSASQIEGETTASKGFVIYEGDVDWSTVLVEDETDIEENTNSSDNLKDEKNDISLDEPAFDDDLIVINENMPEDNTNQDEDVAENVEINKNVVKEENIDIAEEEVISDETTEGDDTTDETPEQTVTQQEINIFNLQKTRNQYVWVPVKDSSRIYGVDSNGKVWGKLYGFSKNGRTALNWKENDGIMSIINYKNVSEPNVIAISLENYYSSGVDKERDLIYTGFSRYEMLTKELEQNYYEIIESIKKYGGFYIGRYETGGLNDIAVVKKMNTDIADVSWYTMYKKCLNLKGINDNVKTAMITGNLYDETLEWLVESEAKISDGTLLTYQLLNQAISWGNCKSSTFNYIASNAEMPIETEIKKEKYAKRIPTGSTEYSKVNNIYDMAGNVFQWTTEVCVSSYTIRVIRGDSFDVDGSYASSRSTTSNFGIPHRSDDSLGCRSILWIK